MDGRVLSERDLCCEECRLVWLPGDDRRWRTYSIDDCPEEKLLSYLARIMSTSVRELEDTYFRWLQRTDEQLRAALDAYDEASVAVR